MISLGAKRLYYEWGTYDLDLDVAFHAGNMHIHPVVKGLGAGTMLRQDERDVNSLLVLDSHVPVLSRAMVSDFVWAGGYVRLNAG